VIRAAFATILLSLAVPALAGPFGVNMGDTVSKYQGKRYADSSSYTIVPPQPNREFESYMASASPGIGICDVRGLGKTYSNDRYGEAVRTAYDTMVRLLSAKYGPSTSDFAFVKSGALWDGSADWVMAIKQNERTHATFWTKADGAKLPDSISGIALEVRALNSTDSYLALSYDFDNLGACRAAGEKSDARGL
jgi:hypothetical protein